MNKLLAVLVATVALGASADDSYLYWMVDSISWTGKKPAEDVKYARVGVMENATGANAGYLSIFTQAGEGTGSKGASSFLGNNLYASLGDYAKEGYSFYIELFNDSWKSLGRSEDVLDYSKAMADYVYKLGISTPPSTPWQVGSSFTTQAIPEPSSALLLLLGCAGLALKRKKQAKA